MSRSPFIPRFSDLPGELPIFPLAGAVVMPGVQLPLNIFEPRYLNMVEDALAADHLIGMIQPAGEGAEDGAPDVHRVGCAGRITSYSETSDGRIILVLTGVCRFEVLAELPMRRGYRRVRPGWEPFEIDYRLADDGMTDRASFLGSLRSYAKLHGVEIPWDDIESMRDGELANLLCAHLPLSPDDKQALIETIELPARSELMRGLMEMSSASSVRAAGHKH
jgi:Lon protease-like protein